MKALNLKKIIKGICFLAILLVILYYCQRLLQAKWISSSGENTASTSTWQEYRELEENTVDVLFLGTSHVYFGIDPMYIYDRSGITSYVFGGPGLRFDLTYITLEDALKTQKPSVVFLDMSAVQFDFQQTEAKCHKVSDQLPISMSKIEYAFDNDSEEMKPLDVLFPLLRYHTRWQELGKKDFQYVTGEMNETYIRGHYISYENKKTSFHFEEESEFVLTDRNRDYLQRIDALCEENGIELICYKIPTPTWYRAQSEGAAAIAEELGVPYLELYHEVDKMGLDVKTDFRDKQNHLNQYGAEKVCAWLTDYMQENLNLQDQRSTNQEWNEDLVKYKELLQERLDEDTEKDNE